MLALVALVLGSACSTVRDARPGTTGPVRSAPQPRAEGFGTTLVRLTSSGATGQPSVREGCAWLAALSDQHRRGLMGVTDLEGHLGMVFRFETDVSGSFYMKGTPLPLSIAWFTADGSFVSAADMEPCLDAGASCPTYAPAGPYRFALEVPKGALPGLGVGPGARLDLAGSCRPEVRA